MGMFDWLSNEPAQYSSTVDANESGVAPASIRVENSQSAETLRNVAKKKPAKSASGKTTFSLEDANSDALIAAENAKILDAILDPKVWRGAVAAPGDAMAVLTGKEHWLLSDDEKDTLAKTGAATARAFAVTDPRWLALSLFAFSVLSIYGSRIVKDLKDKKTASAAGNKLPAVVENTPPAAGTQ